MSRDKRAIEKINRVSDSIHFRDTGSFPIQDIYFWDEFLANWRKYFGLSAGTDIFKYYDLDIVCCSPNIDPVIDNVVEIEKTPGYVIYKGGFGSILKMDFTQPVPCFIDFAVKEISGLEKFAFEDPGDKRRYERNFAPVDMYNFCNSFYEQLNFYKDSFFILGNICEARETAWRVIGMQNELIALKEYPEKLRMFADRAADFNIEIGSIQLSNEYIDGLIIYGDVAYGRGLLMSPGSWKEIYFPALEKICAELKRFGKPLFYHTDGNYLEILDILAGIGIDAIHPNEAKSGIDVVKLKEHYQGKIAFMGNIDALKALSQSMNDIEQEIAYKMLAVRLGGYLPGGDDIPPTVSPENYDYYISLLKKKRKSQEKKSNAGT